MTSNPYTYAGLTPGERLWLARRRAGQTLAKAARAVHGVTPWKYGEWEHDRHGPIPYVHLSGDRLTSGERCVLARRRAGWSVNRVAREVGWSHVTVLKWEASTRCDIGDNPLASWWDERGWPRAAAA